MKTHVCNWDYPQMGATIQNAYFVFENIQIDKEDNAIIAFHVYFSEDAYNNGKDPVYLWKGSLNSVHDQDNRFSESSLLSSGKSPQQLALEFLIEKLGA